MHKHVYLLFLLLISTNSPAQNLISNPSFEAYDYLPTMMCKTGRDFERAVKHWIVPNEASTDLVSPRLRSRNLKAIKAHSGQNMAGIVINGDFWAEYIGMKLGRPLTPGVNYYVEFWISMPSYYSKKEPVPTYLNDHFGVYFGEKKYQFDKRIVPAKPQVTASERVYVEPLKWTKVYGNFVAEEASEFMYIGQFWDDKAQPELAIGYFFIDDVWIEPYTSTAVEYEPSRYYKVEGQTASVIMDNVYFETDKSELLPESFEELDKLVRILQKNPGISLNIEGHTDNQGAEDYNLSLSERRAGAVRQYLVDAGIPDSRLSAEGYGFAKPVSDNRSDDGRQQNRRVEFVLEGTNSRTGKAVLGPEAVYVGSSELDKNDETGLLYIGYYQPRGRCITPFKSPAEVAYNSRINNYQARDAYELVVKRSQEANVIFLNYDIRQPQSLAFAIQLLQQLQEQGYSYLGLNDIAANDAELSSRGYPVLTSANEAAFPMYGELLRTALQSNYNILPINPNKAEFAKAKKVARDASSDEEVRAWAQAMNISRILSRDPSAKIIVLTHELGVREVTTLNEHQVAYWFKKLSKNDPLTIDQLAMSERCKELEHKVYRARQIRKPTIFIDGPEVFVQKEYGAMHTEKAVSPFDLQIYLPPTTFNYNRPHWLALGGVRKPFLFNPDKHGLSYPCLIRAYRDGEDIDFAVPVDVIEIQDRNDQPALMLADGKYILALKDPNQTKRLGVEVK